MGLATEAGDYTNEIEPGVPGSTQPIEEEDDLHAVISVSIHQPGPDRLPLLLAI